MATSPTQVGKTAVELLVAQPGVIPVAPVGGDCHCVAGFTYPGCPAAILDVYQLATTPV